MLSLLVMMVAFKWNIYAVVMSSTIFAATVYMLNSHALRERIGYVQERKRTFILLLNRIAVLILLCTCFRLPVCTVATRLGISDAAKAVATDRGTLIRVLNWLPKIPIRLGAVSVVFYCPSTLTNSVLQGLDDMMTPVKNSSIALLVHVLSLLVMMVHIEPYRRTDLIMYLFSASRLHRRHKAWNQRRS